MYCHYKLELACTIPLSSLFLITEMLYGGGGGGVGEQEQ